MQLPDLTAQARPLPAPTMTSTGFQTEDYRAAVAPGNAMTELGGEIGQMAAQAQKQIDTSRAEDAMNQLQNAKMQLTTGQNGFVNQKGADAVTKPILQDYSTQFDDAANQISEKLGTPDQKAMFRQRADVARLQFSDDLMRHIVQQGNIYQEQVYKGGVETETANAAAHWDQPDAVAMSMTRINGLIDQQAHNNGWDATYTAAIRQQDIGALHASVIDQALANKQYVFAQKWFEDHKDQMDKQQLDNLAPKVEDGMQKQLVNGYQTQYLASQDDGKALAAMEKTVAGDPNLDDKYKNVLVGRLQSRQEILANQAERAYQHAMTVAGAQYTTLQGMVDKGGAIDPAYATQVIQSTKGTPYAAGVQTLLTQSKETGGMAQAPIALQQSTLDSVDALIAQNGRTPELDKRRDQIAKVLQNSQQDLKTEGIRAGLERGVISNLAPLDISSPDAIAKSIGPRLQQSQIVGQTWAGKNVSPLTGDEAIAVQEMLSTLPPPQKAAAIATIANATGPNAAAAIAEQLDKKDRGMGLAFAMAGDKTTQGRYTSELILTGQQALKDKLPIKNMIGVTRGDVENTIATALDGAYPNQQLTDAAKDAAMYITAGIAKEQGSASADDIQRAVRLAVGGDVIVHNGKNLPIPAGMDEGSFSDRLSAMTGKDITPQAKDGVVHIGATTMTADNFAKVLPGQTLMNVGYGKYAVIVGGRPVKNSAGQNIIIGIQ